MYANLTKFAIGTDIKMPSIPTLKYNVHEVIMQMNFFQITVTGMYQLFFKILHTLINNISQHI